MRMLIAAFSSCRVTKARLVYDLGESKKVGADFQMGLSGGSGVDFKSQAVLLPRQINNPAAFRKANCLADRQGVRPLGAGEDPWSYFHFRCSHKDDLASTGIVIR